MATKCIGINLLIFLISVCFNAHAQELSYNKLITTRLVDKVYTHSWVKNSFRTSPDNRRVAFVVEDGAKSFVDIDGIEGNRYEKIKVDGLGFSPDCKHIALTCPPKTGPVFGEPSRGYKTNSAGGLVFGESSSR